jgi:hypothetical protein
VRRRPRVEELFVLNGVLSLCWAAVWIWWRRELLLEHFYFGPLLALTHLVTLGFLSSLMMGVLYRLSPMLLGIEARSRPLAFVQLLLFLVGIWGMIAHFWLSEWTGMSWSAFLVFGAAVLQLWNFRDVFGSGGKAPWTRGFVAASLVHFLLAASLGVVLSLVKAYDWRPGFLAAQYLPNVFAHAHLAGAGWVTGMIFGFELALVPTTAGSARMLPLRFALFQLGTLGLAFAFLAEVDVRPYAIVLALACGWHGLGPGTAFMKGRAREWELLPLVLLALASLLGVGLAFGEGPADARAQLAYAFLALFGFMVTTVVTIAFKLFPIWVWKERFQADFGKRPVPGMKELASAKLRVCANVGTAAGSLLTAVAILSGNSPVLLVSTTALALGIGAFVVNFARVARWSLLDLAFQPSAADEEKFAEMFRSR